MKHERLLRKWRNRIKFKEHADEQSISSEQSLSEGSLDEISQSDLSLLPERAILQVCMNLYVLTSYFQIVCLKSGFMNLISMMKAIF